MTTRPSERESPPSQSRDRSPLVPPTAPRSISPCSADGAAEVEAELRSVSERALLAATERDAAKARIGELEGDVKVGLHCSRGVAVTLIYMVVTPSESVCGTSSLRQVVVCHD